MRRSLAAAPGPLAAAGGLRVDTGWIDVPGARLHSWRVFPRQPPPWPAVVLAHGWGAVKEMNLDYVAAALAEAGIVSVVFDHRGLGASTGRRADIDPEVQIADYRYVLTFASEIDGVDAARLGLWGTSFSGGHVLCVAARDARARAVVSQVPTISGSENTRRRNPGSALDELRDRLMRERAAMSDGESPTYVPLLPGLDETVLPRIAQSPPNPLDPCDLPQAPDREYDDQDADDFYVDIASPRLRTWENRVTLASVDRYATYEPGRSLGRLRDTPLLVIVAAQDTITPTDVTTAALRESGVCAETLTVPGGHYNVYASARSEAALAAALFLGRHLA